MADPEKNEGFTEEEMFELLLKEDEIFKDEGRDIYFDDVMKKVRKCLEEKERTDGS